MYYCKKCKRNLKKKRNDILCSNCRSTQYQRNKLKKQCVDCQLTYGDPNHKCKHTDKDYDKIDDYDIVIKNHIKKSDEGLRFRISVPSNWV